MDKYKEAVQRYSKIKAEDTFENNYANNLLVMLNYMRSTITACEDNKVKEDLKDIFIKYEKVLEDTLK